jgi:EAL domain-containing protein (putative c-di-GMP-specific phosphodiesterase class I)
MYQAKENGRQSYQFFKPAMNVRAVQRQSVEVSLRRALERQEFAVHYQPKIDLATGVITGAEALLRWTHPTLGPVSPEQFIPVAEDSGLILQIGKWVLGEACKQAHDWVEAAEQDRPNIALQPDTAKGSDPKLRNTAIELIALLNCKHILNDSEAMALLRKLSK